MSGDKYNPDSIDAVLARIETNLKSLTAEVEKTNKVLFDKVKALEEVTEELKSNKSWLLGASGAISIVASFLGTLITWAIYLHK